MKKVINILLAGLLVGSIVHAKETEIFVKGEKKQDKPHISTGIGKITLGVVAGLLYGCFLPPHRLVCNIKEECTKKYVTLGGSSSHNYKKIAMNGAELALFAIPIYLIIDGLDDLQVFKKIKERIGCLHKTLKNKI